MFDPTDLISLPKQFIIWVLRALWWLGWDFCVQTVGWSVGWLVCRTLSLGHLPKVRMADLDVADPMVAWLVELIGLLCIASAIYLLTRHWPG